MSEQIKIIRVMPVEGRRCYSPEGIHIPENGLEVISSTYWNRRIKDGDVIIADSNVDSSIKKKYFKLNKEDNNDTE